MCLSSSVYPKIKLDTDLAIVLKLKLMVISVGYAAAVRQATTVVIVVKIVAHFWVVIVRHAATVVSAS